MARTRKAKSPAFPPAPPLFWGANVPPAPTPPVDASELLAPRTHHDPVSHLEAAGLLHPALTPADRAAVVNWLTELLDEAPAALREERDEAQKELTEAEAKLDAAVARAKKFCDAVNAALEAEALECWLDDHLLFGEGTIEPSEVDQNWLDGCRKAVEESLKGLDEAKRLIDDFDPEED